MSAEQKHQTIEKITFLIEFDAFEKYEEKKYVCVCVCFSENNVQTNMIRKYSQLNNKQQQNSINIVFLVYVVFHIFFCLVVTPSYSNFQSFRWDYFRKISNAFALSASLKLLLELDNSRIKHIQKILGSNSNQSDEQP